MVTYDDIKLHIEIDESNMPQKVKEAIKAVPVAEPIVEIGSSRELTIHEIGEIYNATEELILGKMLAADFVENIRSRMETENKKKAPEIADAINKQVLLKIREAMRGNGQKHESEVVNQEPKAVNQELESENQKLKRAEKNIPKVPENLPVAEATEQGAWKKEQKDREPNTVSDSNSLNTENLPPRSHTQRKPAYGGMGTFDPNSTFKNQNLKSEDREERSKPPEPAPKTSFAEHESPKEEMPSREKILSEIEKPENYLPPSPRKDTEHGTRNMEQKKQEGTIMQESIETRSTVPPQSHGVPKQYTMDPYREPTE
ncbi:MAG: hypothetical protein Q8P86_02665 [bacterium]|nr:hypothetical protein [bacterium]